MIEALEVPVYRTEEVDRFGRPLWTPNIDCLHSREEGFVFNWETREQVYAEKSLRNPVRQRHQIKVQSGAEGTSLGTEEN